MEFDSFGYWLGLIGIGSLLSTILTVFLTYFLELEKFKREHRIAFVKESLDSFYSPMIHYFDIMRSWAEFRKSRQKYVWSIRSLQEKTGQMYNIMQSGTRFVSPSVRKLWSQWEPLAIAATTGSTYPEYKLENMLRITQKLHEALIHERSLLLRKYGNLLAEESILTRIKRFLNW